MQYGRYSGRCLSLVMAGLLCACGPASLSVAGLKTAQQGVITHSIRLTQGDRSHAYVCYSDLQDQQLTGVACQTDTGLPFFSAAIDQQRLNVTQTAGALHAHDAEQVIAYLTIALFDQYQLLSRKARRLQVDKRSGSTVLIDPRSDLLIEMTRL